MKYKLVRNSEITMVPEDTFDMEEPDTPDQRDAAEDQDLRSELVNQAFVDFVVKLNEDLDEVEENEEASGDDIESLSSSGIDTAVNNPGGPSSSSAGPAYDTQTTAARSRTESKRHGVPLSSQRRHSRQTAAPADRIYRAGDSAIVLQEAPKAQRL